ncbi:hypothetical protein [Streptomyces venezuelae]
MSIDHRTEALRLADESHRVLRPNDEGPCEADRLLAEAQIHATLAARQTTSADIASYRHAIHTYRYALIRHVAEGLALSKGEEAHRHALGLAKYLDSVDLNIDREVDAYIEDLGWGDPRDAWLNPTARRAKWDAEHPSPWNQTDPLADAPATTD